MHINLYLNKNVSLYFTIFIAVEEIKHFLKVSSANSQFSGKITKNIQKCIQRYQREKHFIQNTLEFVCADVINQQLRVSYDSREDQI